MSQAYNTVGYLREAWIPSRDVKPYLDLIGDQATPNAVAQNFSQYTKQNFGAIDDPSSTPVLICAYNEQHDLPVSLLSLANSDMQVTPIVVDNGSTDDTANIAYEMGATVWECPTRGKSFAYGLALARLTMIERDTVLMTDADTIVHPQWSKRMSHYGQDTRLLAGGIVTGNVIFFEQKRVLQSVKTSIKALRDVQQLNAGYMRASGANMALFNGNNNVLKYVAANHNPNYVFGDDAHIASLAAEVGTYLLAEGIGTRVYTRGERINDWKLFQNHLQDRSLYRTLYADWMKGTAVTDPEDFTNLTITRLRVH